MMSLVLQEGREQTRLDRESGRSVWWAGALCLLAGSALSLAYPEPDVFWLAWVAIAPLIVIAPRHSAAAAALCGAAFGVGFFGVLLAWISIVGWLAWGLLVAMEAVSVVLFAVLWRAVYPGLRGIGRIVAPVLLWVALEYLRSVFPLGGFSWGELAQSQHDQGWMLRIAGLGGTHAVSLIVCGTNSLLAEAWRNLAARPPQRRLVVAVAAIGAASLLLLVPLVIPGPGRGAASLEVAIVQGNVPQAWTGQTYEKDLAILDSHVRLTAQLDPGEVDLVVWPESSVGIDLERDTFVGDQVSNAARRAQSHLIVGGNLDLDARRYKVMAFHLSPSGDIVEAYQKTHLVPFGEYVPRRDLLDFIPLLDQVPRDAVAGAESTVFDVEQAEVAPVLSFEADFSSVVRRQLAAGGDLLMVATNTSTWGESWASAQHVAMSQVRAAENHVWVLHAALSGISALIDPSGRVVEQAPLWEPAILRGTVRLQETRPLFTRTGDLIGPGSLAGSVALALLAVLRRKRGR